MGVICEEEPFQKLINQGMIQGRSNFVYRIKDTNTFASLNLKDQYEVTPIHVDVNIVNNDILDVKLSRTGVRNITTQSSSWKTVNISADGLLKRCQNPCST